jgi:outer membrane protein OmpA-like peptidoglycan-associated protein
MKNKNILIYLFSVWMFIAGGCAKIKLNRAEKGGAIGGVAGGVLGGVIAGKGHTAEGAIIGAVLGGAAGAAIGHYMDKQAAELQKGLKNAKVERVGEGIKITFNSGILFDIDSDNLKPEAKQNVEDLAKTLNKYSDTQVLIEGHTDSTGSADHNQALSDRRAGSVSDYLKVKNVSPTRLSTVGYGPSQPVASNSTAHGRELNRRVEIAIYADKKLKRAAKKGIIK